MGNSHSSPSVTVPKHSFKRQRSAVFSRVSLGCTSVASSASSQDSATIVNEKANEHKHKLSHSSSLPTLSNVAYAPSGSVTSDAVAEYNAFLRDYPGKSLVLRALANNLMGASEYRSTWILDTLRRTDYTRLEHTGETYVDYMGGALFPESLIKVHTDFLGRNVMGNTHSVSNR